MANLDYITKHNALFAAGNVTYKMGLNKYSDKNPQDVLPRNEAIIPE
jgi:hypothetical protein